ncbi:hypothetical protein OPT61_g1580 [Boeremia exigua]|uniref:Uncharacterized protein n=1 Tax=Boeremia exigua TaxID=749465 RepID=A0ACC2IPX0_9PLEO|nr:hypothetical protein OPT61_g1580 [Boeremia exigua]
MAEDNPILPQVDWATTGNAIERRRRQNRINQRAQRERRRTRGGKPSTSPSWKDVADVQTNKALLARLASIHCFNDIHILGSKANASIQLLCLLESAVREAYDARSPRTDILFGLTQLNVYRALVFNIEVLGLTASEMHDDALSPFSVSYTYHPRLNNLPLSLQPTAIQRSVPHHPWLDLLPDAALRNNLILLDAAGLLDEDQCCIDMCGRSGVIVWRDPWDPTGWEVTPAFLEKWELALTGCWDLFQSTNYWREKRGEKRITRAMWTGPTSKAGD